MKKALFLFCALLLSACKFLPQDLYVTAISPAAGYLNPSENPSPEISVEFSHQPLHELVETYFMLSKNNEIVQGNFSWDTNTRLRFIPFHSLSPGAEYELQINQKIEDSKGNSLPKTYIHTFHTKAEKIPPKILSTYPENNAVIDNLDETFLSIKFSEEMDVFSVISNLQISPYIKGYYNWQTHSDSSMSVIFYPDSPLKMQADYKMILGQDACDLQGNPLGEKHVTQFKTCSDTQAPSILAVFVHEKDLLIKKDTAGNLPEDEKELSVSDTSINDGVEISSHFSIQFSEAIDKDKSAHSISITPDIRFTTYWNEAKDRVYLQLDEKMKYNKIYTICVTESLVDTASNTLEKRQSCHIRANGSASKPPELVRLIYYTNADPQNGDTTVFYDLESTPSKKPLLYEYLFSDSGDKSLIYMDFIFSVASGSEISALSFMESFYIDTGNPSTIDLIPVEVQVYKTLESYSGPPVPSEWDAEANSLVRLTAIHSDNTINTVADVRFNLYNNLKDSYENYMEQDWFIKILDKDMPVGQ